MKFYGFIFNLPQYNNYINAKILNLNKYINFKFFRLKKKL